jgi:hypothetical protein
MRGWPETGFLRESLVTHVETPKNPVSEIVRGWLETGFLREYLVAGVENRKIWFLKFATIVRSPPSRNRSHGRYDMNK